MEVIDNFLPDTFFKDLQTLMMGYYFPWYYNNFTVGSDVIRQDEIYKVKKKSLYQFVHTFYDIRSPWNGVASDLCNNVEPVCEFLRVNRLYRIKANLNPRSIVHRSTGWHTDGFDCPKTAVFYLNTNNGYTKFKKGGKIKSVENRIIIFDSNKEHAGYTCTNENTRVVMNFNYA